MKVFASIGCRQVQGVPAKKTRSPVCSSAGSNPTISAPWVSMRTLIGAIATSVSPRWNRPVRNCAPLWPGGGEMRRVFGLVSLARPRVSKSFRHVNTGGVAYTRIAIRDEFGIEQRLLERLDCFDIGLGRALPDG